MSHRSRRHLNSKNKITLESVHALLVNVLTIVTSMQTQINELESSSSSSFHDNTRKKNELFHLIRMKIDNLLINEKHRAVINFKSTLNSKRGIKVINYLFQHCKKLKIPGIDDATLIDAIKGIYQRKRRDLKTSSTTKLKNQRLSRESYRRGEYLQRLKLCANRRHAEEKQDNLRWIVEGAADQVHDLI